MTQRRRNGGTCTGGRLAMPLLCALAATGSAQERLPDGGTTDEGPPRYTVEIIVFTYDDPSSAGNEVFAPREALLEAPFTEALSGTGVEEAPVFGDRTPPFREPDPEPLTGPLEEIPARARIELQRLEPDAFRLQEIYRKLERLDAYRPILHAAWTQTTHDRSISPELPLRTLSDPPLGLDGSISLYRSRFLHLDVDLTLDASRHAGGDPRRTATDRLVRPEAPETAGPGAVGSPGFGDEFGDEFGNGFGNASGDMYLPPVRYRIEEDRIMRDGEVRYFDHPRFGMVVSVWRVEDDPSTAASAGAATAGNTDRPLDTQ